VLAVSTAAIFVRLCLESAGVRGVGFSLFIAASRLTIAAVIILPLSRPWQQSPVSPRAYYYGAAAGICLAGHFVTWITSLSFTSIVASTTLVTTNAIWVALLSWFWWGEKPCKLTAIGIGIALLGGIIIAWGDNSGSGSNFNPLLGDILALVGSWLVSFYVLLGSQAQRWGLSLGSYIGVAYTTAALVLLPLPLGFGSGYFGYPGAVYLYILFMAIICQLVGHTSFNWALGSISPTLVTLSILFEPICASFLGWWIFAEVPSFSVWLGGLVLLTGVASASNSSK